MSDILGRYYTENLFSNLLVQQMRINKPEKALEFGVGGGSLLKAVNAKWSEINYYGFDIDKKVLNKNDDEKILIRYADILNENNRNLNISYGSFDIAVCNPPYSRIKDIGQFDKLIKSLNFIPSSFPLTKDIIFLLTNLRYLRNNGKLGIIVPDTLITSHAYINFRSQLMKNFVIEKIIELPSKIFKKTEAKTHILIIKNSKPVNKTIKILKSNIAGNICEEIEVPKINLAERWDFTFHNSEIQANIDGKLKLGEIAEIKRGSFTHKDLKIMDLKYVHSTTYKLGQNLNFANFISEENKVKNFAKTGDIIITRVGSRSVGKVGFIKTGRVLVSDCILIIRVKKLYREILFSYFSSPAFKIWLETYSHGVCAQTIRKKDLSEILINF